MIVVTLIGMILIVKQGGVAGVVVLKMTPHWWAYSVGLRGFGFKKWLTQKPMLSMSMPTNNVCII